MTNNDPVKISIPKLILRVVITYTLAFLFVFFLLFLPAGTLKFWNAWIFISVLFLMMLFVMIYLLIKDPELLQKRIKTKEKEKTQKIYLILSIIDFMIAFIIPGLDFKYHWSSVPLWLVIVATVTMVSGYIMFFMVMKQNSYASRVIEIQENQKVIDSGLYSIVRHPLYLSASILYCSVPFMLGSIYAIIPMIFVPLLLIIRILNEEKVLKKELNGYEEYMKKVRFRFIPFVW
jgi:protein-S-isoprenylcysteine O-methyltransferase Ste14